MFFYMRNKSKLKYLILCLFFMSSNLLADSSSIDMDLKTASDYNDKGNTYQAMYYYQVVLSKDEHNTEALFSLANIDYVRQQYQNALMRLNKILANDSYDTDALLLRGKIHSQEKNWKQALSDLEMSEQLDSDNPDIQTALDYVYTVTGKTAKAEQAIKNHKRLKSRSMAQKIDNNRHGNE